MAGLVDCSSEQGTAVSRAAFLWLCGALAALSLLVSATISARVQRTLGVVGTCVAGLSTSALGLGMQLPLFDGGRGAARVDAAVAVRNLAAAAYEQAVLNAFREVRDALVDVRETATAASAAERRARAARDAFRVAEARQGAGQAGPSELLVARRDQAESLAAVAEVRLERIAAQVDLIRALGGARPDEPAKR